MWSFHSYPLLFSNYSFPLSVHQYLAQLSPNEFIILKNRRRQMYIHIYIYMLPNTITLMAYMLLHRWWHDIWHGSLAPAVIVYCMVAPEYKIHTWSWSILSAGICMTTQMARFICEAFAYLVRCQLCALTQYTSIVLAQFPLQGFK